MTATPGLDGPALELFAACVQHNVDELGRVNEFLIAHEQRQARSMAQAFLDLYEAIERIPDMVRSVYVNDLLAHNCVKADAAYRIIQGDDPS